MQICLHRPQDLAPLTGHDEAPLPEPGRQVGVWAVVLALALLSYGTHVAGIRVADVAGLFAGNLLAVADAQQAASVPAVHPHAPAPNR